ncbi:hypothetical protein L9F63_020893, partial [Diploptera punctata]
HPNLKIFMTHCGVSSLQEIMHVGIPVIVIPIFGDQVHNCKKLEEEGAGVILDYDYITVESITSAIQEVLLPK